MLRTIATLVLVFLVGFPPTPALSGLAEDHFSDGMQAFRNGDYKAAATAFMAAKAAGMESPALYYNLGATYYRLGDYTRSETAFLKTAGYVGMEPLASYNLGLVNLKQSDHATARTWFEKSLAASKDDKLIKLARYQLSKLGDTETEPRKPSRPSAGWTSFVTAGFGYDDNVTLDNDTLSATSSQSDTYYEFLAATRGPVSGTQIDGLVFKGSVFADIYNSLTEFNLAEANLGLYKAFSLSGWHNQAGGYLTHSVLGGNDYLQSVNLELDTRTYATTDFRLRMRGRYRQIRSVDSRFAYVEGSQASIRIEGRYRTSAQGSLRAYYDAENNDRNDLATSATFTSFSPLRRTLRADYSRYFNPDWYLRLGMEYRNSRYSDDNVEPSGNIIRRRDERLRYLLTLDRKLGKMTDLAVDYVYTDNSSNIERYSYERNTILVYLLFIF